jgi:hypothetical protein
MACRKLKIDIRTRWRWLEDAAEGAVNTDGRKDAGRKKSANAPNEERRGSVPEIADSPEETSKPPAQRVTTLTDKGEWVASESRAGVYEAFPVDETELKPNRPRKRSSILTDG